MRVRSETNEWKTLVTSSVRNGRQVSEGDGAGTPQLEVVIVSYRSLEMLRACVDSVLRSTQGSWETTIHVVDNASKDGTIEAMTDLYPDVRLYEQPTNSGFSKANNRALRITTAPYVLVLNPDALLPRGVLEVLFADFASDHTVGMIGCRLEQANGEFDHASKRSLPTPFSALKYMMHAKDSAKSSYLAPLVSDEGRGYVEAVNGAFMLIRRQALQEVGLFDESFWMYGEDLDWCKRFGAAGWRILYDGRVTAIHLKGGVSGKIRGLHLNYEFHKSMRVYYAKHFASDKFVTRRFVVVAIWARFGLVQVVGQTSRLLSRSGTHGRE